MSLTKTLLFAFFCLSSSVVIAQPDSCAVVVPSQTQQAWADAEIGVLIHFDMPVYRPDYNWRNWGSHPDASVFNPSELNTDQWLDAAQKLGAKYAVLVAKHCSGFSLWPTEAHAYSIKNSPYKEGKGDIVKDFVESCRKYGIRPGIYASTTANGYLHVDNPGIVQEGAPVTQEEYNRIVTRQLTELWSNYGPLFEIWFDGGVLARESGGADILSLVQQLQPQAIAFQGPFGHPNLIRWVGNEEGYSPYPCWATAHATTSSDGTKKVSGLNGDPEAPFWCPGEADFTLRRNATFQGGWFWGEGDDDKLFTIEELMRKYEASVGRNTNMLLGLVVDRRGLVPDADVERVTEYGEAIRTRFAHPLKQVSGTGYLFDIPLDQPETVGCIVLSEDISKGERVLSYELQGRYDGDWTTLAEGSCIGHKRIETFTPRRMEALRLRITSAKATPHLAAIAAFPL